MIQKKRWAVLLGTHNQGKIKEFQTLLKGSALHLLNQHAPDFEPAEENGLSFIENAILKARHASEQTGLPALADDSGLMVAALKGAPGLYSARYCGKESSAREKCAGIIQALNEMQSMNPDQTLDRSAMLICVLALVKTPEDPDPIVCRAEWQGVITHEPKGQNGFGYEPIFYLPDQGCTAGELSPEEKARSGHRGKAVGYLLEALAHRWPTNP